MLSGPVWLIGIDGASFDILGPMIKAGKLPVIAGLMDGGAHGILKSTIVPYTPQAWASVITGKNPGKHGVFGFVRKIPGQPLEFLSSKTTQGERLWTWFGRRQLTSLVVNVPLTYPPEPLNGQMITGMMTPSKDVEFTYPGDLKERLRADWPGYVLDIPAGIHDSRDLKILDALETSLETRADVVETLVKEKAPDFLFSVYVLPDRIQHVYGHYIHPASTAYDSARAKKWRPRIWDSYAKLDKVIGRLISLAPSDANILFVSDHGFTVERGGFYANDFLADQGLLTVRIGSGHGTARTVISKLNVPILKRFVPNKFIKRAVKFTKEAIDWSKTSAYAASFAQQGININLRGREPEGIVEPGEYEDLRRRILAALGEIKHPKTNQPVLNAYPREAIFSGSYLESIPDIVLDFYESGLDAKDIILGGEPLKLTDGGSRGIHHRDGLFIASGPAVKKGRVEELTLEDIAPNVLALGGLEVPTDLDGQVRPDVFDFKVKEVLGTK